MEKLKWYPLLLPNQIKVVATNNSYIKRNELKSPVEECIHCVTLKAEFSLNKIFFNGPTKEGLEFINKRISNSTEHILGTSHYKPQ